MREFIERGRQAPECGAFLRAKLDTARAQIASGQCASDAEVVDFIAEDSPLAAIGLDDPKFLTTETQRHRELRKNNGLSLYGRSPGG